MFAEERRLTGLWHWFVTTLGKSWRQARWRRAQLWFGVLPVCRISWGSEAAFILYGWCFPSCVTRGDHVSVLLLLWESRCLSSPGLCSELLITTCCWYFPADGCGYICSTYVSSAALTPGTTWGMRGASCALVFWFSVIWSLSPLLSPFLNVGIIALNFLLITAFTAFSKFHMLYFHLSQGIF